MTEPVVRQCATCQRFKEFKAGPGKAGNCTYPVLDLLLRLPWWAVDDLLANDRIVSGYGGANCATWSEQLSA
jgi:hypothetical protein